MSASQKNVMNKLSIYNTDCSFENTTRPTHSAREQRRKTFRLYYIISHPAMLQLESMGSHFSSSIVDYELPNQLGTEPDQQQRED